MMKRKVIRLCAALVLALLYVFVVRLEINIVKITDKRIGVLYERDNYAQIVFSVVGWK